MFHKCTINVQNLNEKMKIYGNKFGSKVQKAKTSGKNDEKI